MSVAGRDFTEEVVFSAFPQVAELFVTADRHACGFHIEPSGIRFVWDGVAGEPFEGVVPMRDGLTTFWSTDGRHVAYIGMRGGRSFVGRDGAEDPSFEAPTRSVPPTFSADGAHLAYGAQVDGVYRLVLDGRWLASEATLAPIGAVFSPDGSRLAYVEQIEDPEGKPQHRIVLDGVAGPLNHGMRNAEGVLQFSPDSQRFASYRIKEHGREGQWVVDGVEQQWVNDVRPLGLAQIRGVGVLDPPMLALFSPDSRRFAYCADVKEKGVAVVEDDVRGPLFRRAGSPTFSADSKHMAYLAQASDDAVIVVRDGVAGPAWPDKGTAAPVFSPDGAHIAFTFLREQGGFLSKRRSVGVVLDDQLLVERPGDDVIVEPVFSDDGRHLAWWLRHGSDWFVYVDDRPGPRLDAAGRPCFMSSARVGHRALLGQSSTVVVDGRPGPLAQATAALSGDPSDPHFRVSLDGEHVAWIGLYADGMRPVIDERVGPAFEQLASCSFPGDGSAEWWGWREGAVYRITARQ